MSVSELVSEFLNTQICLSCCAEKVQAEIDSVIGQSRLPSMRDQDNVPYTGAVIHEIQRMGNITPLSVPRMTNKELKLRGFIIPKVISHNSKRKHLFYTRWYVVHHSIYCHQGVIIIPNLASVLFDMKEWETQFTFNPGHFLNEEGKFVKPATFIPFSIDRKQNKYLLIFCTCAFALNLMSGICLFIIPLLPQGRV